MASEMLNTADSLYTVHKTKVYIGYLMFESWKQNGTVFKKAKL